MGEHECLLIWPALQLPVEREKKARNWKLEWAQRQLKGLQGMENDLNLGTHSAMVDVPAAAASCLAMGQASTSNAGAVVFQKVGKLLIPLIFLLAFQNNLIYYHHYFLIIQMRIIFHSEMSTISNICIVSVYPP